MANKAIEERKRGDKLIMEECALVDTSNRTRCLTEKSVLALASKKPLDFTVMMLSTDKKAIYKKLLESKHDESRIPSIMHSVKLYHALKGFIDIVPEVYICADGCNISLLEHYLKKFMGNKYDKTKIHIWSSLRRTFGKKILQTGWLKKL